MEPKPPRPRLVDEIRAFGDTIPHKSLFLLLLAAWILLFHFLGNGTFGYVNSPSLFAWLQNLYDHAPDEGLGKFIPLVVLALIWWKRAELSAVPKRVWWPALVAFAASALLHVLGYIVQQPRISIAAFFIGLYAITGLLWGWRWLRATFFPYFLMAFVMPSSNYAERFTFPMRVMATNITVQISHWLGIEVAQQGTLIFEHAGRFQYNVEAACSGIRSLTIMLAMACIFAFVMFQRTWKRLLLILLAFPLAILGNSMRLLSIVVVAEIFGQKAGNYIHEKEIFSLIPYVPVMLGLVLATRWFREEEAPKNGEAK